MAKSLNSKKKETARQLFIKGGLTQIEIADMVGVSKVTINKWIADNKWKQELKSLSLTRSEMLMHWQNQLLEINNVIANNPEGSRFPTPALADIMSKLTSNINKLQVDLSVSDTITAMIEFLDFVKAISNQEQVNKITNVIDEYIKSKL